MAAGATVTISTVSPVAKSGEKTPDFPQLARNLSARVFDPKSFSAALEAAGVSRSAGWVRAECCAGRIATLPAFPGRHVIPASELARLLGVEAVA